MTEPLVVQHVDGENLNEEKNQDGGHEMRNLVDIACGVHEGADGDVFRDETVQTGDYEEPFFLEPELGKRYNKYKKLAEEKLYPTCKGPETTLSAIVELYNMKKMFGWSGNSVTYLLSTLRRWLPKGSTLPKKYPVMKEMLKDLGMEAKCIHACEHHCILYYKEYEDATSCPIFGTPRYKVKEGKSGKKETKEPCKVLRYFPVGPRLKRLYTIPWIAHEMTWHARATPSFECMRHLIDSHQWDAIKTRWPEFAKKERNVWLGISTDGFNPRGIQSCGYSCWPVIMVPYNLPPSLCMKSEFQMMCLLIPGRKAPGQDIDVFLKPLVDELKQLWEDGVEAYDMYRKESFQLKAIVILGIHDLPVFGNLSGCTVHGYFACPFQKRAAKKRKRQVDNGEDDIEDGEDDGNVGGVDVITRAFYKKSILYELQFWSELNIRHCIDVMHTEKNVTEHIIDTILDVKNKSKDTWNARKDLKKMNMHSGQWISKDLKTGKEVKPVAAFVLSKADKIQFCQILKNLKLPSGFSSNLSNNVTTQPPSLSNLKSHDYHVIMEYLLPVLLQHAFPGHNDLRKALQQISLYFRILCSKVLIRSDVQKAKFMVAEAMCVLEKYFPPAFFDISIHLMVHLADEALICGPVRYRWMYPFERAMKDCKNIPSNKRYVEGSIAESYLVSESVRYAMEYMPNAQDGNHKATWEAFLEEGSEFSDEGSILGDTNVLLRPEQFIQIRRWVLFRRDVEGLADYYSNFCESLQSDLRSGAKGVTMNEIVRQTNFIDWLYKKLLEEKKTDSELWRYVKGPLGEAKAYKKYRVNGFVFSPKSHDDTVATQDNGVCMEATTTFRASRKDKNPINHVTKWYGVIKQILEVNYIDFVEVVFYCDWVKVEDKSNGCKLCLDSNLLMVNLNRPKSADKYLDEPVTLASEASQVFYSKDLKNPDWSVVIHSPKRLTKQVDDLSKPNPNDFQQLFEDEPNLADLLVQRR